MKNNRKSYRRFRWASVVFLILSVMSPSFPACYSHEVADKSPGPYGIFKADKGLARLSFEYGKKYTIVRADISTEHTEVLLEGPKSGAAKDFTLLALFILRLDGVHTDLQYYVEDFLKGYSPMRGFKILERLPVTVQGIVGEEVTFFYIQEREAYLVAQGIPPKPVIVRSLMFIHNDLLWWMNIGGLESSAEADKADFEHVIKTLKILE